MFSRNTVKTCENHNDALLKLLNSYHLKNENIDYQPQRVFNNLILQFCNPLNYTGKYFLFKRWTFCSKISAHQVSCICNNKQIEYDFLICQLICSRCNLLHFLVFDVRQVRKRCAGSAAKNIPWHTHLLRIAFVICLKESRVCNDHILF